MAAILEGPGSQLVRHVPARKPISGTSNARHRSHAAGIPQRNVNGTAILELHPLCFSTVGVESKDDLVKNKFGEYGEMQKGWTAEDAKGFIKVTSTALRAYYSNHKDEKI